MHLLHGLDASTCPTSEMRLVSKMAESKVGSIAYFRSMRNAVHYRIDLYHPVHHSTSALYTLRCLGASGGVDAFFITSQFVRSLSDGDDDRQCCVSYFRPLPVRCHVC